MPNMCLRYAKDMSKLCLNNFKISPRYAQYMRKIYQNYIMHGLDMFHFQFLDPLSSFSVGYKSESNNANDSKKEDLSQLFGM